MGISAPSRKDVSTQGHSLSPGHHSSRLCFGCSKPRISTGGRTDKRTRMWYCVDCVPLKFKDDNGR